VPKVMIVDDDRTTTGLLQTLLELDGFEVILAADGGTAMQIAQENMPDAFLVDFHLSDYEGTDFVRQVRQDARFGQTPVIMTSGLDREEEAMASGADHFLIKPFDPGHLVVILNQLLGVG
jgi:DNA-binding response OmpR family regulator